MQKKKFGIVSIIAIIFLIIILLLTKTDLLKGTGLFIDGSGNERIESILSAVRNGQKLIITDRQEDDNLDYTINRIFDDPYIFWVDLQYNAMSIGDVSVIWVHSKYNNVKQKEYEIEQTAKKIISKLIDEEMTEYDKVEAVHNWICDNITYAQSMDDSDQDVYGALVLREARCAGYAKAFTYLLDLINIKSEVISGESIDDNGNFVDHAWNVVYIEDEPYYFDITWNDKDNNECYYDWFGVTKQEFNLSHFPNKGYDWVDAKDIQFCYYIKNKMYMDRFTLASLISQISKQGKNVSIKCADRKIMEEIIESLNSKEDVQYIMQALGINHVEQILYTENTKTKCLHIEFVY